MKDLALTLSGSIMGTAPGMVSAFNARDSTYRVLCGSHLDTKMML